MMTAMKPVLDFIVDANVVFFVAFGLWALTQFILSKSRWKNDFALQLRLLRIVFLCVVFGPALSFLSIEMSQAIGGTAPLTASDLVVAAYLRGDIAMTAIQFEAILNSRSRIFDAVLAGEMPWVTALIVAIAIGALVLIVRAVWTIAHIHRLVSQSYVWRRTRNTDVRLSDTITIPFAVRGLFRRHVVLPSNLILRPKEMRVVLAHEFEHLRQGDVEWELIFELLKPLLYWNPVFLLWKRAFARLREFSCDRAVLRTQKISPREYADCLLRFFGQTVDGTRVESMNVGLVRIRSRGARMALERRLLALQKVNEHHPNPYVFWWATSVLALGIFFAAASVRDPGDWSHDRLMLSTVVNLERMEAYGYSTPPFQRP